jgi:hypothetical protein
VDCAYQCIDTGSGCRARPLFGKDDLPLSRVKSIDGGIDGQLHLARCRRRCTGHGVHGQVADQEQGSAGSDARTEPIDHLAHRPGHVDVQTADEVEPPDGAQLPRSPSTHVMR